MPPGPLRVVVADDQAPFRIAIRRLVARTGDLEVVAEARDGAAAVRLAEELQPDLVLLDVRMPGLGGREAAAQIARRWPSVAVLLCSSHALDDLPADLPAPFVPKESLTADMLRAAAATGSPVPPAKQRWLEHLWSVVRPALPTAPARVLDLGCGPHGGLVPRLRAAGYDALGVDPQAPAGPAYRQARFEDLAAPEPFAAVVASTSLHHVDDLGVTLDAVAAALVPDGVLIVVEWDRTAFDEATAEWCLRRLPSDPGDDGGWLRTRLDEAGEDRHGGAEHLHDWAADEDLHAGDDMLAALRARFAERSLERAPYFFADLHIPLAEEQAAIDAGRIRANALHWVGGRLNREQ